MEDDKPQVIIVGFGRFGQVIGRLLMANKMRITVLERDISAVNLMRNYGYKVYFGDATQLELLRSAGAEEAQSIVITCNEPEDTMRLVEMCQQLTFHICIFWPALAGALRRMSCCRLGVTPIFSRNFLQCVGAGAQSAHHPRDASSPGPARAAALPTPRYANAARANASAY